MSIKNKRKRWNKCVMVTYDLVSISWVKYNHSITSYAYIITYLFNITEINKTSGSPVQRGLSQRVAFIAAL